MKRPMMLKDMKGTGKGNKKSYRGKKGAHSKVKLSRKVVHWGEVLSKAGHTGVGMGMGMGMGSISGRVGSGRGRTAVMSFRQLLMESDSKRCPAFTSAFEQHLPTVGVHARRRPKLSGEQRAEGWCLDGAVGGKVLCKRWMEEGEVDGVAHSKGGRKRTWEGLRGWNPSGCECELELELEFQFELPPPSLAWT